jgi:hypothetical protein
MTTNRQTAQAPHSPLENAVGRSRAMTVISLLRPTLSWPPGGLHVQRLVFALGRVLGEGKIRDLSMIHFARFVIIDRLPDYGQEPERLRQALQLFESNYNGTFDQYIDAFVDKIPTQMHRLWQWSYGFPWPLTPSSRFKEFINRNEFTVEHYYVAYPEETTKTIDAAFELLAAFERFHAAAAGLPPQAFAAAYRAFVAAQQERL